ncbi:hypothetical protein VNO78_16945 [Psophocarpus tetragonolobus]|uniref:Uncharacterized protein n=1 Tax=Psophocarpus tetragonolobus TaxID=3891 RepID=A0AAN9XL32_PSOTE
MVLSSLFSVLPLSFSSERACKSLISKQSLLTPLSHKATTDLCLRTRQPPSLQNPTTLFIILFLLLPCCTDWELEWLQAFVASLTLRNLDR